MNFHQLRWALYLLNKYNPTTVSFINSGLAVCIYSDVEVIFNRDDKSILEEIGFFLEVYRSVNGGFDYCWIYR